MNRQTIYFSEETQSRLMKLAFQRNCAVEELVQEAVERYLSDSCSLSPSIGMGKSGLGDLSQRCDQLLWQEDQ